MQRQKELTRKFSSVFDQQQATMLAEVITDAYSELVKTSDFNELKSIVKELAQAQNRTELRVEELAQAQNRTELRVEELAEAQKETQKEMGKLAQALVETNRTVGGLGQSMAYALENEAYRMIPSLLLERYGIELSERLVRTTIRGQEINLFGRGKRQGKEILLVGETKLRLDERRRTRQGQVEIFEQLQVKAEAVAAEYPGEELLLVLMTHFARPQVLKQAEEQGIIVLQSFEW